MNKIEFADLLKHRRRRSKRAVSEIIGTIVLIAVTVVLGAGAWIWASSSSLSSQANFNNAAAERFVVVSANFSTYAGSPPSSNKVTVWIYNSGITTSISSILLNSSCTAAPLGGCNIGTQLLSGQLRHITITLSAPTDKGHLQTIKAVGQYGYIYSYQVVS